MCDSNRPDYAIIDEYFSKLIRLRKALRRKNKKLSKLIYLRSVVAECEARKTGKHMVDMLLKCCGENVDERNKLLFISDYVDRYTAKELWKLVNELNILYAI